MRFILALLATVAAKTGTGLTIQEERSKTLAPQAETKPSPEPRANLLQLNQRLRLRAVVIQEEDD
eukprot:CAMPEP_0204273308 /NCGR_PEP_ID=MMETSP0468-20130131/23043_1 /ASSEMBLY_ACC=CAM_ASM_000383 /TAXON_ID=2969 /ORGANISM="Oxyrrhis marina" /LENGTH=64 /DNA_ID=CAMNT_0051249301 /DNA_START=86 /DNA_END=280 /DNA_ORIENTATION=+